MTSVSNHSVTGTLHVLGDSRAVFDDFLIEQPHRSCWFFSPGWLLRWWSCSWSCMSYSHGRFCYCTTTGNWDMLGRQPRYPKFKYHFNCCDFMRIISVYECCVYYLYIYIYIYIYFCVFKIYVYIYIYISYIYIYICICICICVYIYRYVYICGHIYL